MMNKGRLNMIKIMICPKNQGLVSGRATNSCRGGGSNLNSGMNHYYRPFTVRSVTELI